MRDVLRDRQQWSRSGMASTGAAPATMVALDVLRAGGTAADAAIAASAALCVCLPMACGPAGDMAALVTPAGAAAPLSVTSLGRCPGGASVPRLRSRGLRTVPVTGILSATTPAMVDGWYAVHRRFGRLPMARLLAPAVELAASGSVVTGQTHRWIADNLRVLENAELAEVYAPGGTALPVGAILRQEGLAAFLRLVADMPPEDLRPVLDERLLRLSDELGGEFQRGDTLAGHARIEAPLALRVGDARVYTTPAPTQGALCLQNLAVYARLAGEWSLRSDSEEGIHVLSEVVHRTFGWRLQHLADPDAAAVPDPLADAALRALAAGVDRERRSPTCYDRHYSHGDTTHFVVADSHGGVVSWVQSLGLGFGAGVGAAEWGLLLCNRLGRSCVLDPQDANRALPGHRPVNTIFPWAVGDGGGVRTAGGTPGGDGQAQWNAQTLAALLVDGDPPLRVLNRPRWTYLPGSDKTEAGRPPQLHVDDTMPDGVVTGLQQRGHDVVRKAGVGGVTRLVTLSPGHLYALDDGRQEGLTAGV